MSVSEETPVDRRWFWLPVVAAVVHEASRLYFGNLGTPVSLGELSGLVIVTIVGLLGLSVLIARRSAHLPAVAFAAGAGFWLSRTEFVSSAPVDTIGQPLGPWVALVYLLLLTSLVFWFYRPALRTVFLTYLVVSALLSTAPQLVSHLRSEQTIQFTPLDLGEPTASRDLVVIVLDEYARTDVLNLKHGFDNRPFENELAKHDIAVVPGALANYSFTSISVPSMLTGQYPILPGIESSTRDRRRLVRAIGGENPLVDLLHEEGYTITHVESPWADGRCTSFVDDCRQATWFTALKAAWFPLATEFIGHPLPGSVRPAFAETRSVLEEIHDNGRPDFVFVHVISPHPPFWLAEDCELVGSDKATYVSQLQCVNQLVVDSFEALSPDAVVVVTADHGTLDEDKNPQSPTEWTERDIAERMAVFSALRVADGCARPDDGSTLVVIMNHAVACALGVEPDSPEEQSFAVSRDILQGDNAIIRLDVDSLRANPYPG